MLNIRGIIDTLIVFDPLVNPVIYVKCVKDKRKDLDWQQEKCVKLNRMM